MNAAVRAAVAGETRAALTMRDVRADLENLENEAWERGFSAGLDAGRVEPDRMVVGAFIACAISGAIVGAIITALRRW